jgi:hypothetical protein
LTSKPWEEEEWVEKWQNLTDGSYICHILAIMAIPPEDGSFYFDEAKFKWTEANFLQVLINPDWDMPEEQRFPISMLIQAWGINPLYSIKGLEGDIVATHGAPQNQDMSSPNWEFALAFKKRSAEGNTITTMVVCEQLRTQPLVEPQDTYSKQPNFGDTLLAKKQTGEQFPNASDPELEREETRTTLPAIGTYIQETTPVPIWLRVVMRATMGATTDCVLTVKNGTYPNWRLYWPKILIPRTCWGHKKWLKAELYKEAIKWLPLKDSSKKKPMLKLEHLSIFKMEICKGMHTVVVTLPKSYTFYTLQWATGFTFVEPHIVERATNLCPSWVEIAPDNPSNEDE